MSYLSLLGCCWPRGTDRTAETFVSRHPCLVVSRPPSSKHARWNSTWTFKIIKVNMQARGDIKKTCAHLMSALQQMVLFVLKWTELAVIIIEAWVGIVLFSLIKIFKEKTLYMTAGPRPGTVCVSPILSSALTNMSRTATFASLVPSTYSKYASNHPVCSQPLPFPERRVTLGWQSRDCLFNFRELRQGWDCLGQRGRKWCATSPFALYATLQ